MPVEVQEALGIEGFQVRHERLPARPRPLASGCCQLGQWAGACDFLNWSIGDLHRSHDFVTPDSHSSSVTPACGNR